MKHPVAILIPIYNAFHEAFGCLQSVREHTSPDVPLLIIDDGSSDGEFSHYLQERSFSADNISLLRNDNNLGFVKTVNRGLEQLKEYDVLLLNSDTLVTSGWLNKLQDAAYSRDGVGTVTPLTNNGVVASFPHHYEDNCIPSGYTLERFAQLIEDVSERERPEIPSCVGFCVYLKREMLNVCGVLDEETFEKGYGEENDLSRRMRAFGYVDILDDATYVYHKGECSFGEAKADLVEAHTKILQKRYPDYFEDVRRFRAHNPLREVHARIERVLFEDWEREYPRRILHILHNGPFKAYHFEPGGTELQVARLIDDKDEFAHYSLVYMDETLCLTAHLPGWKKEFLLPVGHISLKELLRRDFFEIVHVHHFTPHVLTGLSEALAGHGNYFVSLHDFTAGCPRNYLLTPTLELCSTTECSTSCGYSSEYISAYRDEGKKILEKAKKCFVFSDSSRELLQKMFGEQISFEVVPHGTISLPKLYTESDVSDTPPDVLRIVLPGKIARHKGSEVLKKLLKHKTLIAQNVSLEWHIVGDTYSGADESSVYSHGSYTYDELPKIVGEIAPHVALFLSLAPETYAMTVDEQLRLGVPVIVPPQGAPAERVAVHGAGSILEEVSERAVIGELEHIVSDWEKHRARSLLAIRFSVTDYSDEVRAMKEEYRRFIIGGEVRALFDFLFEKSISHIKEKDPLRILVGKTLGTCVVLTERLGIRSNVESVFQRVLPAPLKAKLKKARIATL